MILGVSFATPILFPFLLFLLAVTLGFLPLGVSAFIALCLTNLSDLSC